MRKEISLFSEKLRIEYQKKNVDKQVKVESRENIAFDFVKLPQEYLHWSNDSGIKKQNTTCK
jgi:hypothetical protein